jgi:hypothetical protein
LSRKGEKNMRLSSTAEAGLFCDKLEEFSSHRDQNAEAYGFGIFKRLYVLFSGVVFGASVKEFIVNTCLLWVGGLTQFRTVDCVI